MDSFLYSVTDAEQKVLLLKSYSLSNTTSPQQIPGERIFQIFEQDGLLKMPYAYVKVAFLGQQQTFVPNRLYNPDKKATYLHHVAGVKTSTEIYSDDLTLLKAQNIYTADRATYNFIAQMFPNIQCYHLSSALFLGFREKAHYEKITFFVNVRDAHLQLFLFKGKSLLYSNMIIFQSVADFTYYIMMLFEQFDLSPATLAVNVSGAFQEGGKLHRSLSQYVKFIQPTLPAGKLTIPESIKSQITVYKFFDLMSIPLCE